MQSKAQLIESILQLNSTAKREWLDGFEPAALKRYLDHLQFASEPRGGGGSKSFWLRPGDTPAVVTRRPAA